MLRVSRRAHGQHETNSDHLAVRHAVPEVHGVPRLRQVARTPPLPYLERYSESQDLEIQDAVRKGVGLQSLALTIEPHVILA